MSDVRDVLGWHSHYDDWTVDDLLRWLRDQGYPTLEVYDDCGDWDVYVGYSGRTESWPFQIHVQGSHHTLLSALEQAVRQVAALTGRDNTDCPTPFATRRRL